DYQAKKLKNDEGSYILTIIYDDEEDLEKTISDIYSEISFLADLRNCYVEADICSLDGERSWY
ncbi:MAG TPA: recombinase family protein, partial [Alphaproteobacteria bacterium]|nr:recombinase family protein [Alphaproteobacteria bacterium]